MIVAERPTAKMTSDPGDIMPTRPRRTRLATSSDQPSTIQVKQGPVATTVEVTGSFYGGGALRRVARFYNDHPRIDFETELNDVPNFTVVVSEFPLADDISRSAPRHPLWFLSRRVVETKCEPTGLDKRDCPRSPLDRLLPRKRRRFRDP